MATRNKGEQISKNEFLKNTYNRKVRITYDRLTLVLKNNINKVSSITNFTNYIAGIIVSVMGTIITITTATFPPKLAWLQYTCVGICSIIALYYIISSIYFFHNKVTPEDIIYELEMNNELDEDNHSRPRRIKQEK